MLKFPYYGFNYPYYNKHLPYRNNLSNMQNHYYTPSSLTSSNLTSENFKQKNTKESDEKKQETRYFNSTAENQKTNKSNNFSSFDKESFIFDLFGIKLYFDDILILSLLFFLYKEGVKDYNLFISLLLLLIS